MSLLIRNVVILGAPRKYPEKCDLFVSGGAISAIGSFPKKEAREVIDGEGAYLAPGFIDIDSTSDHYLSFFEDPGQEDLLREGVTTIIGGHCGASLAPLFYGELASIRKWANLRAVNVNWSTVAEFFSTLDRQRLGVNFGTFAGHSTIRREILGEAIRDLTKNEQKVFLGTLSRALEEGAFGLSTGLEYVHTRATPYAELKALLVGITRYQGIHATHLRHTGRGIGDAVREAMRLRRDARMKTLMVHLSPRRGSEEEYADALAILNEAPEGEEVRFTVSPFPWRTIPLYRLLPDWAQNGNLELMRKSIEDDWLAKRIVADIEPLGPEDFHIEEAPGNPALTGKQLSAIVEDMGIGDSREAILAIMRMTKLRAVVSIRDVREDLLRKALAHPRALIGSHAPAFSSATFRFRKAFSEMLQRAGEHRLPLEEAVHRLSREPARFLGLKGRGEIREGFVADLVLFRGGKIRTVVVGGEVALRDAVITGQRTGKTIRRT